MSRWNLLLGAVLLAATALSGCSPPTPAIFGSEEATPLPPIKVDLPPPPSFVLQELPLGYPDGTVSVFGLRKQPEKYLSKEVQVKAYLLEIYQCPVCPKGQTCKPCSQPHFYVGDAPNTPHEKAMMVVDYIRTSKQKPPLITVGKQYTINGTFNRNSPTGFADSDGLVQFNSLVDDRGNEFLSPSLAFQKQLDKTASKKR